MDDAVAELIAPAIGGLVDQPAGLECRQETEDGRFVDVQLSADLGHGGRTATSQHLQNGDRSVDGVHRSVSFDAAVYHSETLGHATDGGSTVTSTTAYDRGGSKTSLPARLFDKKASWASWMACSG